MVLIDLCFQFHVILIPYDHFMFFFFFVNTFEFLMLSVANIKKLITRNLLMNLF